MTPYDSPETAEEIDSDAYADIEEVARIMSKYWAAEGEAKLFETLTKKEEAFYDCASRKGLLAMARMAYSKYYGLGTSGIGTNNFVTQGIQFVGEDGELVQFDINEFRALCDQIFNMTTKNRPAFQAQAINTDPQTLGQINASDSVIKYYYEQVFGERKEKEVVKSEGLYAKAYTHLDWDADGGESIELPPKQVETEMGPMPGPKQSVKTGAFVIERKYWWQVPCEPNRSEHDGHIWRSVIGTRSKWEMIARYPLFAKDIEDGEACHSDWASHFPGYDADVDYDEDSVTVRLFYHAKTAALPEGRKCVFVGSKLVEDGPLPIDVIPVIDFMSCELDGTCFGISDLWNLIPIAQMKAQILSDVATNIEAFGRPPLVVDEGTDFDLDALANGQKVLTKAPNTAMPEVVQFPQVAPISIQILDLLRRFDQSVTGLNAISRGEADASVKSGAHAALYHAMAVEAQAPRGASLDLHRERVTNVILQFLKRYATHPQLVAIAGEDERPYLQRFTAKDIAHVHRVVIKTANPMMRTQAGRLQVAEMLRDWPGQPIKDPGQILELLVSGQWKPMYQPERTQQLRVKEENARLAAGPPVQEIPSGEIDPMTGMPAVDPMTGMPKMKKTVPTCPVWMTDNAAQHIIGHLEVLNSPDTLENMAKQDAVFAHILEHVEIARNGDPYLAQLLGNPPPPMAPGMDPNATSSGAEGPSDDDLERVQKNATPPDAQKPPTDPEAADDSMGARMPKAAQPPNMA